MSVLDPLRPRVVAFYLPEFYPEAPPTSGHSSTASAPTAWQRLAEAVALFPGHDQPRAPADLGYTDLRVPEVRLAQADLARAYGVDAFCHFHFWGEGRRGFERVFAEVLDSGEPDFPLCLCWANEHRPLSARPAPEVRADDRAHAELLASAFADPRYLRVDGRPVFVVRRPQELVDPVSTLAVIRESAARRGTGDPLLLAAGGSTLPAGFDAELDWPELDRGSLEPQPSVSGRPLRALANLLRYRRWLPQLAVEPERAARLRLRKRRATAGRIPVVLAGWDDTPLRGSRGTVLTDRRPELFESDMRAALARAQSLPEKGNLVFLFAWNAWLQGAALEPDRRFGRAYLAAVARARMRASLPAGSEAG